ncbi:hypothetical protein [Paenibacillus sp. HJGM_3]|uniref:hypothetical protein n=1 Tax=Paenibacillus sp. HJGM_3 TaxID=3379816 RepID=UPI00385A12C1
MNSSDFIQIRSLEGILMMYHKKQDLGLTVSTRELVIQRPHMTYYVMLPDIVSIYPYESLSGKSVRFVSNNAEGSREIARLNGDTGSYRLYAAKATMHSRSGLFEIGKMEFVLPIAEEMLDKIAKYGEFDRIS